MLTIGSVFKKETHKGILLFVGRPSSFFKCKNAIDLSILGNPFPMDSKNDRDFVCDKYFQWLKKQYFENMQIKNLVDKLAKAYRSKNPHTLLCFCHPKRCHAEEIIKFILSIK